MSLSARFPFKLDSSNFPDVLEALPIAREVNFRDVPIVCMQPWPCYVPAPILFKTRSSSESVRTTSCNLRDKKCSNFQCFGFREEGFLRHVTMRVLSDVQYRSFVRIRLSGSRSHCCFCLLSVWIMEHQKCFCAEMKWYPWIIVITGNVYSFIVGGQSHHCTSLCCVYKWAVSTETHILPLQLSSHEQWHWK